MKRILSMIVALCAVFCLAVPATQAVAGELIVSAAASLTDAFTDIEPAFEAEHPGVDVVMNFASSGALYRQIEQGAPADVYASANPKWMNKAVGKRFRRQGRGEDLRPQLPGAVHPGRQSRRSHDPERSHRGQGQDHRHRHAQDRACRTVHHGSPGGRQALRDPDSKFIFAESVRQVLDYLSRDEVDCGFVYGTDAVKGGDKVKIIEEIPLKKPVTYPIATLKGASDAKFAQEFVDFVLSDKGQALLKARGFKQP